MRTPTSNLLTVAFFAGVILGPPPVVAATLPERLSQTGLYADIATQQIAPELLAFTPQYPLWSDGAAKRRWISLPAGTSIDASDPDAWIFPIGTKLWKEFAFDRRIETRFIELTADGWSFATYRWLADGSDAVLAARFGERAVYQIPGSRIPGGGSYDLPARSDCRACHEGNVSRVLGFSALQLSAARDPGALHGEPGAAGEVDLAMLVRRGWLRGLPQALLVAPPEIPARSAAERAALGYLHGNCSHCHNSRGPLAALDFSLEVRLGGDAVVPAALTSAVDRIARFQPAGAPPVARIAPGRPESSLLLQRMSRRDPISQMPPLGTRVVDTEAVALVERWIRQGLFETYDTQTASKGETP
jgi:hypothetical protein